MKKLISVLMITYNHEKYIERAIESVLMQEGDFDFELLIGNDKSPDNTKEILEKYQSNEKIKIFNREKNLGATNNSWDLKIRAKGDYIAVLEGDDYWITKDKLQKQLEILEKNKDGILCYTDSIIVDENNIKFGIKSVKSKCLENFYSLLANASNIPTGTILYKNIYKEKTEKLSKLLHSSEIIGDLSLFAALIKKGKFYKLNEYTGAYRYITDSKKSTSYSSRSTLYKEKELYKVYKGIAEYYEMSGVKKFFFVGRKEYRLLKEIKKLNKRIDEYLVGERVFNNKLKKFIYILFSPLENLFWSLNKKKYRK